MKYPGNKHNKERGVHALRKDVIYKNLLRGLRRYLWSQFEQDFDVKSFERQKKKMSQDYKNSLDLYYQKHFAEIVESMDASEEFETSFKEILAGFISEKYILSSRSTQEKKLAKVISTVLKKFHKKTYSILFSYPYFSEFMRVLEISGFIKRSIEVMPSFSGVETHELSNLLTSKFSLK